MIYSEPKDWRDLQNKVCLLLSNVVLRLKQRKRLRLHVGKLKLMFMPLIQGVLIGYPMLLNVKTGVIL